uniref:Uncharacterized protein n=1 Tax=Timema douglasi TaxID=61478 RepID=A0A7R8W2E6_TIMDO|nr:unnamed protein product [Timema douglasi]
MLCHPDQSATRHSRRVARTPGPM